MKSRFPMIWLALLTVYQSYVSTDALSKLKTVEANQEYTLQYMAKAAKILKRIRTAPNTIASVGSAPCADRLAINNSR